MRKKAFLIPIITIIAAFALWGAIAWANSVQPAGPKTGPSPSLEEQEKLIHSAIAQRQQKKADEAFSRLITEFAQNKGLDEVLYT